MAAVTFLLIIAERVFIADKIYQLRPAPDGGHSLIINLGQWRGYILALVSLLAIATVIIPLLGLVSESSFSGYWEAFNRAGDSLLNSLLYALAGASLLVALGFFTGHLIYNRSISLWHAADFLTILLFALPGTVIGIGLISMWNRPATSLIYGTPILIILGYLAQYIFLSARITTATLTQIPSSMEQAAQVAGAGWLRRIFQINIPLAGRGLVAAWLVSYIFCLRDTGIAMVVYPPGRDTLPVRIFTLMANNPAELISALCVTMVIATIVPLSLLVMVIKRWSSV